MASVLIGLENISFVGKETIIIFKESGCSNCEHEMNQFKDKYAVQEKGIQLIFASVHTDKVIFETIKLS